MGVFGYEGMESSAIEEMRSLAIEDGSLWLWSLWLSRNGAFGYRGNEPLAIEEWDGVASLGRGLGASRGFVGSSRLNFSRSYSWSVLLFRSV